MRTLLFPSSVSALLGVGKIVTVAHPPGLNTSTTDSAYQQFKARKLPQLLHGLPGSLTTMQRYIRERVSALDNTFQSQVPELALLSQHCGTDGAVTTNTKFKSDSPTPIQTQPQPQTQTQTEAQTQTPFTWPDVVIVGEGWFMGKASTADWYVVMQCPCQCQCQCQCQSQSHSQSQSHAFATISLTKAAFLLA